VDLAQALAFSHYADRALTAWPELRGELQATIEAPFDWAAAEGQVSIAMDTSPEALHVALRVLRRRLFLHTMARDLSGPGITPADVVAATEYVTACFEIVDSRIHDWKIRIQDTVADNASSGIFALGREKADPRKVDFVTCGIVVEKNGEILSTGAGAAALGSPLICVAWLANTLGAFGVALKAGEIVLSGSLVPLEPVRAGDFMRLQIAGIGGAQVRFV